MIVRSDFVDYLVYLQGKALHLATTHGPIAMSRDDAIEAVRQEFWDSTRRMGLWKIAKTNEYARSLGAACRVIFEREVAQPVREMLQ